MAFSHETQVGKRQFPIPKASAEYQIVETSKCGKLPCMSSTRTLEEDFSGPDDEAAVKALSDLLEIHDASVHNFIRAKVSLENQRKDIYQEACLSAIRSRRKFDQQKGPFKTWFFRLVMNRISDWDRYRRGRMKQRREEPLDILVQQLAESHRPNTDLAEAVRSKNPNPEQELMSAEKSDLISDWLEAQDYLTRIVIRLRFFRGYTRIEVAKHLSLTVDQVRYRDNLDELRTFVKRNGY